MKTLLKYSSALLFQLLCAYAFSQDIPVTVQKLTDGVIQMPSQTGASGGSAYVAYRKGNNLAGAPTVQVLGAHTLLANNKLGIGLNAFLEQINFVRNASFNLVMAYHLPINSHLNLSFGLNTEYHHLSLNTSQLNGAVDMQDPLIDDFKPRSKIDFSPGLALNHNKYFVGFTINRLRNLIDSRNNNSPIRTFYTTFLGYRYLLNNNDLLEPLIIIRYDPNQKAFQNDYQLFYTYNQAVMAGLTYRGSDVFAMSLGFIFSKRFVIGYSYQFVTSGANSVYHTNTHELSLRFNFNKQYYNQPMFLPDRRPISNVTKEKLN
ncbi:MAG TPA: PorP/SprF family type IX secretion system membrane protein [Cytophagaceae bacterium]|jgi:type IX secretion system PorP/SprF family membrane protein